MNSKVIDRSKWAKFGEAKKNTVCWSVGENIDIDITHPELKRKHTNKLADSGTYIIIAQKLRWANSDILRLKETDPDNVGETFWKIYNRKTDSEQAEIANKFRPEISAVEEHYSANMTTIQSTYKTTMENLQKGWTVIMDNLKQKYPDVIFNDVEKENVPVQKELLVTVTEKPDVAETSKTNLGIRGRFNAKLAERKKTEDLASVQGENTKSESGSGSTGMGLSARLKQMKHVKQDTEQESTLFISNLAEQSSEQDLRQALLDKFNVRRINFVRKAGNTQHSGIGFIVLASPSDAEKCLEFVNGYRLNHMVLCASFSTRN